MNQVNCDKCNKLFNIDIKEKRLSGDLTKKHFKCPYCEEEYLIEYEDSEVRRLKKKIVNIRNEIQTNPGSSQALMKKYRKLYKKIAKYSEELKKRIESEE